VDVWEPQSRVQGACHRLVYDTQHPHWLVLSCPHHHITYIAVTVPHTCAMWQVRAQF
jgi:hypothetical protein